MLSPDLTRSGAPLGGRLFTWALTLVLVASWGLSHTGTASGTEHTTPEVGDDPTLIDWRVLRGLNYETGERTEELQALDGKLVKMAGFPVPFEDWASNVTEFLLVPYQGACVHVPAPPPHQVVWVKMRGRSRARLLGQAPVWVEGTLHIENGDNVYAQTGFRLVGMRVSPYR